MDTSGRIPAAPVHLFFGNRAAHYDFLFEKDWLDLVDCGTLTNLHLSFSRPNAPRPAAWGGAPRLAPTTRKCWTGGWDEETRHDGSEGDDDDEHDNEEEEDRPVRKRLPRYVQDKLWDPRIGKELARLIEDEGAFVFVCGDGAAMAKDVHEALLNILCTHGSADSMDDAKAILAKLMHEKRYIRDIWS